MTEIARLLAYDDWANRETLRSLGAAPAPAAIRRFAHILGAQRTWLNRITGGPPVAVWPEPDLAAFGGELDALLRLWHDVLSAESPGRAVSYVNTKGQRFASTARDILPHVVFHGAYHRGQIASDVRAHGGEPAYTDFMHATRERHV